MPCQLNRAGCLLKSKHMGRWRPTSEPPCFEALKVSHPVASLYINKHLHLYMNTCFLLLQHPCEEMLVDISVRSARPVVCTVLQARCNGNIGIACP